MGVPERENPLELDAVAAEVQGGSDGPEFLPTRITRYSAARGRTLQTLSYIVGGLNPETYSFEQLAILSSVSEKLSTCCNWLHFRDYFTVGKVRLHAALFCREHLLCEFCAIRRGAKALAAYVARFEVIKAENPALKNSMITFTIANGPDLLERFDHIQNAIRELNKRRTRAKTGSRDVTEWSKVFGWVGSYEIKRGKNSGEWHVHVHLIALHVERIDAKALKAEWQRITGDSHVLRIDPARHPETPAVDFLEVFKYAVKFSEIAPVDRLEAFLKLSCRRLIFSGGLFRGVVIPKDLADDSLEDQPFLDLFYVYADKSGYSLEAVRDQQGETRYMHPGTRTAKQAAVFIRDGDMKAAAIKNKPALDRHQAKAAVELAGHVASGQRPEGWTEQRWKSYLADHKKQVKRLQYQKKSPKTSVPLAHLVRLAELGNAEMGIPDD